jgi:hypothetical protein
MNKMILMIPVLCILSVGYIDADVAKQEQYAQNLTNYSAFQTITPEQLQEQRDFEEKKMKEMQILIDKAK